MKNYWGKNVPPQKTGLIKYNKFNQWNIKIKKKDKQKYLKYNKYLNAMCNPYWMLD